MERPNTKTVCTEGTATAVWCFLHRKIIVLGAHTQGGKKIDIVWIPFCYIYTNNIYIVKKTL